MGPGADSTLEATPTWATASIITIIIIVSIAAQRAIHHAGLWMKRRKQSPPLKNALENIKEELMLLGVISLLLAVSQAFTTDICVSQSLIQSMLPCRSVSYIPPGKLPPTELPPGKFPPHKLPPSELPPGKFPPHKLPPGELPPGKFPPHNLPPGKFPPHKMPPKKLPPGKIPPAKFRKLLDVNFAYGSNECTGKGKLPVFSATDIHELHMFIFILGVVHIFYSLATVYLGEKKINTWKKWENEAQSDDCKMSPSRETEFILRHIRSSSPLSFIVTFLQQFAWSVTREDYFTLRRTFLLKNSMDSNFDFHVYINVSIADDFKTVIGMSEYFWIYVILFFLINVHGWYTYLWISFLPICVLLSLGAKLQHILSTLAVDILKNCGETVHIKDNLFWFGTPRLLLHLLHFTIFQNAFELALLFWMWATFGWDSCLMENKATACVHIISGVLILFQCSYTTLPLCALLTQMYMMVLMYILKMGSTYKAEQQLDKINSEDSGANAHTKSQEIKDIETEH